MNSTARKDPLPVHAVEFLGGMVAGNDWRPPEELPEIAFWGRSNVGKSSLLNRLVGRRKLARVSNTPGRTREINFFRIDSRFILVDLPGYGYARASKDKRATWGPLIAKYLNSSQQLRGVVELLDIRHDPSKDDRASLDLLATVGVPVLIVATKCDKLSTRAVGERIAELSRQLSVDEDAILPVSSETGRGRDELATALVSLIEQPSWRNSDTLS